MSIRTYSALQGPSMCACAHTVCACAQVVHDACAHKGCVWRRPAGGVSPPGRCVLARAKRHQCHAVSPPVDSPTQQVRAASLACIMACPRRTRHVWLWCGWSLLGGSWRLAHHNAVAPRAAGSRGARYEGVRHTSRHALTSTRRLVGGLRGSIVHGGCARLRACRPSRARVHAPRRCTTEVHVCLRAPHPLPPTPVCEHRRRLRCWRRTTCPRRAACCPQWTHRCELCV